MTQTPDRIWINTRYIGSPSTIPVLPCNIGTSEQSLSLSDDTQYLLSTPAREAAPDMLEALQSVLAIDAANYKDYGLLRADIKAALNMAYDAVNKATGEAQ